MVKTFDFLQKLLESTIGIALTHVPYSKSALTEFLQSKTEHAIDPLLQQDSAYWQQLFRFPMRSDTIYEFHAPCGITFLIHADPQTSGTYIVGPALTQPFSQENALHTLEPYGLPPETISHIMIFCSKLPVISGHTLYRTGDLVFGYLTNSDKSMNIVQMNRIPSADAEWVSPAVSVGEDIAQMRQIETRYEYSMTLTDAVKQGNLSLALHIIGQYAQGAQNPARNENPLRNAQNYCIVLNTQLRYALEETGIHPYRVDKLSNEIGLEIEQLKKLSEIPTFFSGMIRRYCRLVQEHTYPNLKPLTHLAVIYIKEHLADNLTVKDTAKALTVNANYLSTRFHQEMGMTFIDFVNQERTNQAAALLRHTNLQIQQISSIVGYNNTSYFAKQFLRFQGMPPSRYRKGIL